MLIVTIVESVGDNVGGIAVVVGGFEGDRDGITDFALVGT